MSLENVAVATSGDYFQIQKFGYHHIVHPGLKKPMRANEDGVSSVTVVCKTCAEADAYAVSEGRHSKARTDVATRGQGNKPGRDVKPLRHGRC